MGVNGLWKLLEPTALPVQLESLRGKTLAIDASIWIYHFLKAMRDPQGRVLAAAHIVGFFRRICKLLFLEIRPVFVFDGRPPILKKLTTERRQERRHGREQTARATANKLLALQLQRSAHNAVNPPKNTQKDEDGGFEVINSMPQKSTKTSSEGTIGSNKSSGTGIIPTDQYALPEIDSINRFHDDRFLDADELDEYSKKFTNQARTGFIDDRLVDFHSSQFDDLPMETRYQLLSMARLKSRLRMGYSADELSKMFPNEMDFSKFQIERVAQRNFFTQRLMNIAGMEEDLTRRVSSEKNREYMLKRTSAGYVMSLNESNNESNTGNLQREIDGKNKTQKNQTSPFPSNSFDDIVHQKIETDEKDTKVIPPQIDSEVDELFTSSDSFEEIDLNPECKSDSEQSDSGEFVQLFDTQPELPLWFNDTGVSAQGVKEITENNDVYLDNQSPNLSRYESPKAEHGDANIEKLLSGRNHYSEENAAGELGKVDEVHSPCIGLSKSPSTLDELDASSTQAQAIDYKDDARNTEIEPVETVLSDHHPSKSRNITGEESANNVHEFVTVTKKNPEPTSDTEEMNTIIRDPGNIMLRKGLEKSVLNAGKRNSMSQEGQTIDTTNRAISLENQSVPSENSKNPLEEHLVSESSTAVRSNQEENNIQENYPKIIDNSPINVLELPSEKTEATDPTEATKTTEVKDSTEVTAATEATEAAETVELANEEAEADEEQNESIASMLIAEAEENQRFAQRLAENNNRIWTSSEAESYSKQISNLRNQFAKEMRDSDQVTTEIIQECQQLLQLFGIPYITAPSEAEAQCAELRSLHLVEGVVTDDGDTFLFDNDAKVYRNMFSQAKFVECYTTQRIQNQLGLDRHKLIDLAFLLGSDYTEGIVGIGPVNGVEIMAEFDNLKEFAQWWRDVQLTGDENLLNTSLKRRIYKQFKTKMFLPESFPNKEVVEAYLHPSIDPDKTKFVWGIPDIDSLRDYMLKMAGWGIDETNAILLPVVQEAKRRGLQRKMGDAYKQSNLLDYYQSMHENPTIHSKRARKATEAIRKKPKK